ncbi:EAL domain-containing protein [Marinobacterium mangrovicola]|uniref:Diguanylate cyclase (GGDEF)-like protein n=1 Tax=Marinobacterium mangrovicola TaxID=1476959 RepID=A0A4R1GG08_9GAMM|nr:EAL domain-containing protein [Marinobacterium mangrovicola]TCK05853.1 diguanylate cyclase (GGDEF)-like protein [Marinobacterium mangrovicola]
MKALSESSYALLDKLSSGSQQHRSLNLLFVGFPSEKVDPLLSLIRTGRMAPRGRHVNTREELSQALSERSWDLLLCTSSKDDPHLPYNVVHQLAQHDRDIPVIELSEDPSPAAQLRSYKDGIQALLPNNPGELLLHVMRHLIKELDTRRRLRQTEAMLEVAERHYHRQVSSSSSAIGYLGEEGFIFANDSLVTLLGFDDERQLLAHALSELLPPADQELLNDPLSRLFEKHEPVDCTLDLSLQRADNTTISVSAELQTNRYEGQLCLTLAVKSDYDLELAMGKREEDPLTGLKNGTYLTQKLDETAQRALTGGHDSHLIYLRLNQYAQVTETQGQEAGETLLTAIAERLAKAFPAPHLPCRLEDDSFAILFAHSDTEATQTIGRKLCRQVTDLRVPFGQSAVSSSAAVGIVTINDNAPPASELLNRAHIAVNSLDDGKGCAVYRSPSSLHQHQDDDAIKRILDAISDCRLKMLFQPVVSLTEESEEHNYEVLIRLLDENNAPLAPNLFMTSVEQSDVMVKMDRWVVERSLQMLKDELDKGFRNRLFINIAGRSLQSKSLLSWVEHVISELDIPPQLVVFQISETDAASDIEQARVFTEKVHTLKCQICLKHFGSSPNSHRVFASIHADYIKLDAAYVQDLESGDMSIKEMQEQLQPVTAESRILIAPMVENNKIISKLFRCGIQLIQGYYLQPPREAMDYDYFE